MVVKFFSVLLFLCIFLRFIHSLYHLFLLNTKKPVIMNFTISFNVSEMARTGNKIFFTRTPTVTRPP